MRATAKNYEAKFTGQSKTLSGKFSPFDMLSLKNSVVTKHIQ